MNLKRWCVVDKHHILAQSATRAEVHPKWRKWRDAAKPGQKLHVRIVRCEKVGSRTWLNEAPSRAADAHAPAAHVERHHPKFCPNCGHAL